MVKAIYNFIDNVLGVKELCRYGTVGLAGAFVDIVLLNLLVQLSTLDIYYSIVIAFIVSVVVSYFLHTNWTFCVSSGATRLLVYVFVSVFGLILNVLVMYYLMEYWHWWYNFAKVVALVTFGIWNYFVSKAFIFRKKNN